MAQVNVYEAKTRLSKLLDQALAGEDVIIARHGRPIAQLVPLQRKAVRRRPGAWKDRGRIADDFDETPTDVVDSFYVGSIDPE